VDLAERLGIEQQCRDLVSAVTQHGDRREFECAADLFAGDGVWVRGGKPYQGRAGVIESYSRIPASQFTRHMSANCLVTVEDADHASAITYYVAYHHDPGVDQPTFPLPFDPPFSLGEWHDRFVRTSGVWRIARRETRRLFERRGGH
jgi:hypothetical protein